MHECHDYDDIISLPHHVSGHHPQMSLSDRAAQFSPFAALSGLGAALDETARFSDDRLELSEEQKEEIGFILRQLQERIAAGETPEVETVYFCPDNKKSGGTYQTTTGVMKKVDEFAKAVIFRDRTQIPLRISFHYV